MQLTHSILLPPQPTPRRLLLFKYDGLEFVEQREVSLPDAAACMQLAGGTLYAGLAKRWGGEAQAWVRAEVAHHLGPYRSPSRWAPGRRHQAPTLLNLSPPSGTQDGLRHQQQVPRLELVDWRGQQ